jgi:protein-tyrosine sulfotransferase
MRKSGFGERRELAKSHARETGDRIMKWYLARDGGRIWCDKSLSTMYHAPLLADMFPDARFICLYRHAMDVVHSVIEASPWGFTAFGITPYVARHPNNFVAAGVEYWIDHTEAILAAEQARQVPTIRVYYEMLVRDPKETARSIFRFIGANEDEDVVSSAFYRQHSQGAADRKIEFEATVHVESIGQGSRVPIDMIPPGLLQHMNALLERLGYPVVGPDWNHNASPLRNSDQSNLSAPTNPGDTLRRGLLQVLRSSQVKGRLGVPFEFIVAGADGAARFMVDPASGDVVQEPPSVAARIVVEEGALVGLGNGTVNPAVALDRGLVRVRTEDAEDRNETDQTRGYVEIVRQLARVLAMPDRRGEEPTSDA